MAIATSATGGFLLPEDTKWDDSSAKWNRYGDFWDKSSPAYDDDLSRFLQNAFCQMSNIAGTLVRPRWQPVPPNMPDQTTDWMAFGIVLTHNETYAAFFHRSKTFDAIGMVYDDGSRYSGDQDQAQDAFDTGIVFDSGSKEYDVSQQQYDKPNQTFDDGQTFDINAPAIQADVFYTNEEFDVLCSFYGPRSSRNAARLRDGFQAPQNREVLRSKGMGFIEAVDMIATPEQVNDLWVRRIDLTLRFRRAIIRAYPVLDITQLSGDVVSDTDALKRNLTINPPSS